jgi:hypothetical protein
MMNDAAYREHWEAKKLCMKARHYRGRQLDCSYDSVNGGIDSKHIQELIDKYLK